MTPAVLAASSPIPAPVLRPGGGNAVQALQLALADPSYQTRTESVKVASWEVVLKALGSIKEAEIEGAVGALSMEECDVLMKYLYRGLGQPGKGHDKYQALLKWHPAVLKRAGQGSITRAISEVRQAL